MSFRGRSSVVLRRALIPAAISAASLVVACGEDDPQAGSSGQPSDTAGSDEPTRNTDDSPPDSAGEDTEGEDSTGRDGADASTSGSAGETTTGTDPGQRACLRGTDLPGVTGVQGSIEGGATIAVTGCNLMREDSSQWDDFFLDHPGASSFEGQDPQSDGYSAIGPTGGVYDETVALLGAQSMRFHVEGASHDLYDQLGNYNGIAPAESEWWVRVYVRWNRTGVGWPSSHIKMLYGMGGFYLQPAADPGGDLPFDMVSSYDEGQGNVAHAAPIPSGQLTNERWYAIEVHWKDTAPSVFEAWIDGEQVHSGAPGVIGNMQYLLFGVVNACCTDNAFALDNWYDGLAVSSARIYPAALVEVGDGPDHDTASRKMQELVHVADDEIQVELDLAGLGPGPHYLWVTNNQQQRAAAYAL